MKTISILDINAFLYYESRLLDDEQWDEWLECYSTDSEFWMPSWDDNDQLVTNPQEEISLIYYPDRQGLEDRVFRMSRYVIDFSANKPQILNKYVVLKNDYISQVIDIYHI